jgi:hypothetical protein
MGRRERGAGAGQGTVLQVACREIIEPTFACIWLLLGRGALDRHQWTMVDERGRRLLGPH